MTRGSAIIAVGAQDLYSFLACALSDDIPLYKEYFYILFLLKVPWLHSLQPVNRAALDMQPADMSAQGGLAAGHDLTGRTRQ